MTDRRWYDAERGPIWWLCRGVTLVLMLCLFAVGSLIHLALLIRRAVQR